MTYFFRLKGKSPALDTYLLNVTIHEEDKTHELSHVLYHPTFGFCDSRLLEMNGLDLGSLHQDCREYLREQGVLK